MSSLWKHESRRILILAGVLLCVAAGLAGTKGLVTAKALPLATLSATNEPAATAMPTITVTPRAVEESEPQSTAPDAEPPGMQKLIPFPPNVPLPVRVGVSLHVSSLKINDSANNFEAEIDLRYRWRDPRLAFSVREIGTNRIEFADEAAAAKLATIWNPQISITNIFEEEAEILPGLFIHDDGEVEFIQRIKATFESQFALAAFPLDTQSLLMVMLSSKYNANQILLVQEPVDIDASGLDQDLKVIGWTPKGLSFKTSEVRAWNGASLSQMEARVKMERIPTAILATIVAPFLLVLAMPTLLTFFVKTDAVARLELWVGSILALVALNFTHSISYPWLGSDSLVSQMMMSGYVYQLISVIMSITLFNPTVADRMGDKFIIAELNRYLQLIIPFGFLAVLCTLALLSSYAHTLDMVFFPLVALLILVTVSLSIARTG